VQKLRVERTTKVQQDIAAAKAKRKVIFKSAEKYVKEYRDQQRQLIQLQRQARAHGNFYAEAEPRLAFVVRIRGCVNSL
jgi:large subunit ribosomal protein L7e